MSVVLSSPELQITFHEDNQAMIKVMESGKSTIRHAGRAHRVSIAWLHERFQELWLKLVYEDK